MSIVS